MQQDRFRRVREIFQNALEQHADARSTFLEQECQGDPLLRMEVEGLLSAHGQSTGLLERPAMAGASDVLRSYTPATIPSVLGNRFEIEQKLGHGGMGQVYRARDRKLHRTVAVKLLRQDRANDPDRRSRLEREALALSSLNHPQICSVFDLGHDSGMDYLVIEYVEGETLAGAIKRGLPPLDFVLRWAIQICEALEYAHCKGILHRDLKPANIMITDSGIKLLDFGLAKFMKPEIVSGDLDAATTMLPSLTMTGAVMGTLHYMSPEQALGKELDARSDLFSFGTVLYELLFGVLPFHGNSAGGILDAIVNQAPKPPIANHRVAPDGIDDVIFRCLEKAAALRYPNARTLGDHLERVRYDAGFSRSAPVGVSDRNDRTVVQPASAEDRPVKTLPGRRSAIIVLAAAFLAAVAAGPAFRAGSVLSEFRLTYDSRAAIGRAEEIVGELGFSTSGLKGRAVFQEESALRLSHFRFDEDRARRLLQADRGFAWIVSFTPTGIASGRAPWDTGAYIRLSPRGRLIEFQSSFLGVHSEETVDEKQAVALAKAAARKWFSLETSAYKISTGRTTQPYGVEWKDIHLADSRNWLGYRRAIRVSLQGRQIVRLSSDLQPIEASARTDVHTPGWLGGLLRWVSITGLAATWVFGVRMVLRTRSVQVRWRLPIFIAAMAAAGGGLTATASLSFQGSFTVGRAVAGAALFLILSAFTLPGIAGLLVWMRGRSYQRMEGAEHLVRGRFKSEQGAKSLMFGSLSGICIAGLSAVVGLVDVLPDWTQVRNLMWQVSSGGAFGSGALGAAFLSGVAALLLAYIFEAVQSVVRSEASALLASGVIAFVLTGFDPGGQDHVGLESMLLGFVQSITLIAVYRLWGLGAAVVAAFTAPLFLLFISARSVGHSSFIVQSIFILCFLSALTLSSVWVYLSKIRRTQ